MHRQATNLQCWSAVDWEICPATSASSPSPGDGGSGDGGDGGATSSVPAAHGHAHAHWPPGGAVGPTWIRSASWDSHQE